MLNAQDEAALAAMVSDMEVAWRARDAEAYASQFAEDAEHINAYGMWWRGRAEITDAIRFTLENIYPTNPITAGEVSVEGCGEGVAVVQYRWRLEPYTLPTGVRHDKPEGRVTQVVVKRSQGWRIRFFQSTFIDHSLPQPR